MNDRRDLPMWAAPVAYLLVFDKRELLPRDIDRRMVGEDVIDVHQQREFARIERSGGCAGAHGARNASGHDQRFQRYAVQFSLIR